jgi:rhodanese-related sulfurtransferase
MTIQNINCETLKNWLKNNEAVLVDVREPGENAAERIAESNLLPLAEVSAKTLPNFENKKLVLHCRSGKRSLTACNKLLDENKNLEIFNLEGGILAWIAAGFAVEKSGKFFLPLDRQVQLIIGCGVLIGSLLSYFCNPLFFILPAFFGAGLCFAALSGWCGLAILLAKMPWNKKIGANAKSCFLK